MGEHMFPASCRSFDLSLCFCSSFEVSVCPDRRSKLNRLKQDLFVKIQKGEEACSWRVLGFRLVSTWPVRLWNACCTYPKP